MFESSPLMRLEFAHAVVFGFVDQHRFQVTHLLNKHNDYLIALTNSKVPTPPGEYDLTFDVDMHINKDNSLVVETPSRLIYANSDIRSDEEFFKLIHDNYLNTVEANMRKHLETDPTTAADFIAMTDEQKELVVVRNVYITLKASPRFMAEAIPPEVGEEASAKQHPVAQRVESADPMWEETDEESVSAARAAAEMVH